ncbi:MAG: ABC transporter substrate-binding protein [Polyangiaceae bacterium]
MSRLYRFCRSVLVMMVLSVSVTALGADPNPEDFVRTKQDQLSSILKQPKSGAREKTVSNAIDAVFDYGELAQRSLGEEWKNRSDDERKQFRELLEGLVRQTYRRSIDSTLGWQVDFKGRTVKDGTTVVATVAKHKTDARKAPVAVDYAMKQTDGSWRVVDITIEGSSLTQNYRSQFTKIIKKKGFGELITKMKARLAKGQG